MTIWEWKDSYSVGNAVIDAQHRKLLALCRQCDEQIAMKGVASMGQMHLLLFELSEYVRAHFDYEESLMRQCNYPHLEEHISEHARYSEEFAGILSKAFAGVDEWESLRNLLRQWWMHHILKVDMQYRGYLTDPEAKSDLDFSVTHRR